jgi:SAM-dependent methyltransferase
MSTGSSTRLYSELASWWPLLSAPDEYADEAAWILGALVEVSGRLPDGMLELGCGGGNLASHLTGRIAMMLSDRSPQMLEISRALNPGSEHVEGDMRFLRLDRTFEAVLIHDAIMYMTSVEDLVAALATARAHLKAKGVAMVLPDYVAETFEADVDCGGRDASDGSLRALRYLSWAQAPAAGATAHDVHYAYVLRNTNGSIEVVHDRHTVGLFPRATWSDAFVRAGFSAPTICRDPWRHDVFIARPRQEANAG